jgi:hypothetical protein
VTGPGVLPPEAAVNPDEFLPLAFDVMHRLGVSAGGDSGAVHLQHTGPDGRTTDLPLAL